MKLKQVYQPGNNKPFDVFINVDQITFVGEYQLYVQEYNQILNEVQTKPVEAPDRYETILINSPQIPGLFISYIYAAIIKRYFEGQIDKTELCTLINNHGIL